MFVSVLCAGRARSGSSRRRAEGICEKRGKGGSGFRGRRYTRRAAQRVFRVSTSSRYQSPGTGQEKAPPEAVAQTERRERKQGRYDAIIHMIAAGSPIDEHFRIKSVRHSRITD